MKKRFIYIALALVCSTLVMAQTNSEVQSDSVKGIHPYNVAENVRHYVSQEDADWSLFLHGGFNVFDGDFASEKKHGVMAPSVGLGVDYKFNPTWGMGLDYTFRQVGVAGNTKDGADNADKLLRGFQHQAVAYLSFDIFNAFFPKATTKLFALNIIGGGGAMFWRNTIQYPTGRFTYTTNTDGERIKVWESEYNKYHTANRDPEKMDKYKVVGALEAGLDFEFNVSRDIALGLRALYTYFVTDAVDGRLLSNNNDGVFDTELLLRWKFEAQKKSHVDNYVNKEVLSKVGLGAKSAVTPRDTVVLYYRDTTGRSVRNGDTTNIYNHATYITNPESDKPNYYYVYFENDKHNLSDEALVIIQQVADRMNENPDLHAVVIGYCDNVGSVAYNKRLGQNRSQNVMEELLYEYGLNENRMFAVGKGIVVGKRSSAQYAPNRRVEIRLVNTKTFDDLKFQYRDDIDAQKEFLKTRESAKKE
ncbi:MAG: OmpA family protein [Paludibacteraceae bacterium]|nr:OmpA family protein [Paludibacteraceae bacterium]